MSLKKELKNSIYFLLQHNKHGSYKTQFNRKSDLFKCMDILFEQGFKLKHIKNLKYKHVDCIVENSRHLSPDTQRNRRACLSWLANMVGKPELVPSSAALNIPKRSYISGKDQSIQVTQDQLDKIANENVLVSIQLARLFGLRREESMKIRPNQADQGNILVLHGSCCKGGRPRQIPIRTAEQRAWLEKAKALAKLKGSSLIPVDLSLRDYKAKFTYQLQKANIRHFHGLRHAYAQNRYQELTGWACPAKGGLRRSALPAWRRELDAKARQVISEELGHSRIAITSAYLGS